MNSLTDLTTLLRQDLSDPGKLRFTDAVLARCIERAVFHLGRDLELGFTVSGGLILPEPTAEHVDLILLLAQINACQVMRASTADGHSFQSGDKQGDTTSIPKQWANLEASLQEKYNAAIKRLSPSESDPNILRPGCLGAIYEQGRADEVGLVDQDAQKGIAY